MKNNTILLQDEFIQWIKSEANLPESTAKSYCSYVSSVNNSFSIKHNGLEKTLFDLLQKCIDTGNSIIADELTVKVFNELCKKDIDKVLEKAEKTIQNWKSGLNQYREFIYQYIEESTKKETVEESTADDVNPVSDLPLSTQANIYVFTKQDLYDNFTFRLLTQNRPNSDICFPISTIKTLFYQNGEKTFFDKWISNQLDNTLVITKDTDFKLSDVDSISVLENGTVSAQIKGHSFELYSNTADNSGKIKLCVKKFNQIALDHTTSKREILDTNKVNLSVLCDITKRFYHADTSITTGKELRKVGTALLKNRTINKNDIPGLKKELELIGSQIHLQLMESSENGKKSNK
ncbi:MAG: hypothetical protein LBU51_02105 [Bacteroidales bacterium]|jgi:hypothetical protein|nr:hypothetical protein [Bacteroidales bacterium]